MIASCSTSQPPQGVKLYRQQGIKNLSNLTLLYWDGEPILYFHPITKMPRPRQVVSILTLAKEFHVTPATISKALSNSHEVSEALRARIREHADALGFRPRTPRRSRRNICVVLDLELSHVFELDELRRVVVEGVYEFCHEKQIEFSLLGLNSKKLNEIDLARELGRRNADAAVFIGANEDQQYFSNLLKNRYPFACVFDGPPGKTVQVDDLKVGELALNHLADLGHRRIAIARNSNGRHAFLPRLTGFFQAAADRGMSHEAIVSLEPPEWNAGYAWGREIFKDWIDQGRPWSAIFCTCENVALGILSEASIQSINIPKDLSVLTCDDLISCQQAAPPLSVVDIPNQRAGYLAAQHAWESLNVIEGTMDFSSPLSVERVISRNSATLCI